MSFSRMPHAAFAIGVTALFGSLVVSAHAAIVYDLVTVGNPGNANDTEGTGHGRVDYSYQIGKYDVTIGQYTEFLNAVAITDTYSLYNASMETDLWVAGISRTGSSGAYVYSVIGPAGFVPTSGVTAANRPITYVSWFDAARFANWMANGQGSGSTENGAYDLVTASAGTAPAKNIINPNTGAAPTFYIPNRDEWYKAAYYDPTLNGGTGGYYGYATQSNTPPGNIIGSASNQANYRAPLDNKYSVTQVDGSADPNQNYLTDVGAFSGSGSFYGTFDQSGNVDQWNDLDGVPDSSRGKLGGWWFLNDPGGFSSGAGGSANVATEDYSIGFRLASPVVVPEPSSCASLLAGLAFGCYTMFRRRRAR